MCWNKLPSECDLVQPAWAAAGEAAAPPDSLMCAGKILNRAGLLKQVQTALAGASINYDGW
ncbi:MAG: hypothetical protein DMF64_04935 [Acidobacteria bacterium]|nr:MAG: hypothetical protein DMF64_04935 [Acidobacteriota bacterium]